MKIKETIVTGLFKALCLYATASFVPTRADLYQAQAMQNKIIKNIYRTHRGEQGEEIEGEGEKREQGKKEGEEEKEGEEKERKSNKEREEEKEEERQNRRERERSMEIETIESAVKAIRWKWIGRMVCRDEGVKTKDRIYKKKFAEEIREYNEAGRNPQEDLLNDNEIVERLEKRWKECREEYVREVRTVEKIRNMKEEGGFVKPWKTWKMGMNEYIMALEEIGTGQRGEWEEEEEYETGETETHRLVRSIISFT